MPARIQVEVSILVLMDGARRPVAPTPRSAPTPVSILVLMDGARRPSTTRRYRASTYSFNPCFDGWGSPTDLIRGESSVASLGFNPCFDGWGSPTLQLALVLTTPNSVSILVLMDGARRQACPPCPCRNFRGFNPCFDGWGSPTENVLPVPTAKQHGFNPCFDGWGSPTREFPCS